MRKELAGASDEVKHLRERLRKGHEFSDQFCRRAASIRWINGSEAAVHTVIDLRCTEIPDDAELTVSERQEFEAGKATLQDELDHQVNSFLKDLIGRVTAVP